MVEVSSLRTVAVSMAVLCLAACGGGGGGGGSGGGNNPTPTSYTVGGSVSGLSGAGLVLQNSGGNNLAVAASGNFTFTTAVASGSAYAVTVLTQPGTPSQTCTVSSGSGSVSGANVTNVAISCATNTYTVGGSVSGLTGTGLVLQNSGGNNLAVAADGAFTFTSAVASGASYNVSVSTQPTGQTCTATSASGTVGSAAVSNVSVSCRVQIGKFIYVPSTGTNTISSYSIDANTGALTALGSPISANATPASVTVDPADKFLYVSSTGISATPPTIAVFSINGATGLLTPAPGSPYSLSTSMPATIGLTALTPAVIDNASKFIYVNDRATNLVNNLMYGARIDPGTGALTVINDGLPRSPGGLLGYSTLDATGKFLYVPYSEPGNPRTGYLDSFEVDATTGKLTPIASHVPTGGELPIFAQRHPSGKFLLVSHQTAGPSGSVAVFSIDPNTGALTPVAGSPFAVGGSAVIATYNLLKNFVYVRVNSLNGGDAIVIFRMDPTTGVLTPTGAPAALVGQGTGFPIVEPNGKFLIIPNSVDNNIQSFSIDQTTGALTQVAGSPFATDLSPLPLRPDPSYKYYYGVNQTSNTVSSYSLDPVTGAITRISNLPTGQNPGYVGLAGRQ